MQRDWQVDAGIEPLDEDERVAVRERAARAVQAVFAELGFPPVTRRGGAPSPTTCLDSRDLPDRDRAADVRGGRPRARGGDRGLDVARALDRRGFADVAAAVFDMQRQRVVGRLPPDLGDHRRRRAVVARPSTTRTTTPGRAPATASRASAGSGCRQLPYAIDARLARRGASRASADRRAWRAAAAGDARDEVVVAVGPAFGDALGADDQRPRARRRARGAGRRASEARAAPPRLVRVRRSADVAFIGHDGARLAGLGRRGRPPVEGHGGDPPRRPAAARQPRAVRDGAVADARVATARSARNAAGYALGQPGRAGADGARQLRAREADRAHDAAARARGGRGRAGRAPVELELAVPTLA